MREWKMDAMIHAQALFYSTPSEDRGKARVKQKQWNQFMDGLTWEKLGNKNKGKDKQTATGFVKMFQGTGLIPVHKK